MTEIEQQALALVNEEAGCEYETLNHAIYFTTNTQWKNALFRALDEKAALQAEFEQHKRDVSDKAERLKLYCNPGVVTEILNTMILPKPVDPLVEAIKEADAEPRKSVEEWADKFREALAERNARIVWEAE